VVKGRLHDLNSIALSTTMARTILSSLETSMKLEVCSRLHLSQVLILDSSYFREITLSVDLRATSSSTLI
jgi:hypothetical protein